MDPIQGLIIMGGGGGGELPLRSHSCTAIICHTTTSALRIISYRLRQIPTRPSIKTATCNHIRGCTHIRGYTHKVALCNATCNHIRGYTNIRGYTHQVSLCDGLHPLESINELREV